MDTLIAQSIRLLKRTTYGLSESLIAEYDRLGRFNWLDSQLEPALIDETKTEDTIRTLYPATLDDSATLVKSKDDGDTQEQVKRATIHRRVIAKRQLHEVMVEFWADHFNIAAERVSGTLLAPWDRTVLREHALGKFPEFLIATAKSPAMLAYLDNDSSAAAAPNQNYARELMELHTIGVNGGYKQADVVAGAACFAGWGYQNDEAKPDYGTFFFDPDNHDSAPRKFLGREVPGGGIEQGEYILRILGNHPSTAHFLATKLVTYFHGQKPSASLIDRTAQTYLNSGGDIPKMLRNILTAESLTPAWPRLRRPASLLAATLRGTQASIGSLESLRGGFLGPSGHVPFEWAPPNGYPMEDSHWASYLTSRWNLPFDLMTGGFEKVSVNLSLFGGSQADPDVIVRRINETLFGGVMPGNEITLIRNYLTQKGVEDSTLQAAVALALASASFQYD